MIETLYKTRIPRTTEGHEHFFELALCEQTVDRRPGYFVRETQCWWDARAQRTVRVQYTLSPRLGFLTIEEARARYELCRMNRARRGFVHSYTPHYEAGKRHRYVFIEVQPEMKEAEVKKEGTETPATGT